MVPPFRCIPENSGSEVVPRQLSAISPERVLPSFVGATCTSTCKVADFDACPCRVVREAQLATLGIQNCLQRKKMSRGRAR